MQTFDPNADDTEMRARRDARALAICLKRLFDTTEWTAVTDEYIGNVLREHGNKYIGDEKHEPTDAPNPL